VTLNTARVIQQAAFGPMPANVWDWLVARGHAERDTRYGSVHVTAAAAEESAQVISRYGQRREGT
jgi:hypothetical protein